MTSQISLYRLDHLISKVRFALSLYISHLFFAAVPQPVAYTDPTTGLYATPELATAIAAQAGAYNQYQSLYSGMQAMQGMPSVPGMPLGYTTGIPAVPASTNSPVVIVSGLEPSVSFCE